MVNSDAISNLSCGGRRVGLWEQWHSHGWVLVGSGSGIPPPFPEFQMLTES